MASKKSGNKARWLNVQTAAEHLNVSTHRIRKLLWEKRLETRKVDGRTYISESSLDKYAAHRDARKQAPEWIEVEIEEPIEAENTEPTEA